MSPALVNPFVAAQTAQAYAHGRPYFHPLVMKRVRETLELGTPVSLALDVACGTGLSSRALLALAERVLATDISAEMLAQARKDARIDYRLARADALPLEDAAADLVTVSSAFHWLERERFLREARRVLRPGGSLIIYENFLEGPQPSADGLAAWLKAYYAAHPSPPRDRAPFTDEAARAASFEVVQRLPYENLWSFDLPGFVAYLLSQSNAVLAVERGETLDDLKVALREALEPFFQSERSFSFAGFIWMFKESRAYA